MAKKHKLLVFDQPNYANPYKELFDVLFTPDSKSFSELFHKSDVVLFTGGSDVSPHLYGEPAHPTTVPSPTRDKFETYVWNLAVKNGKKILGICRGAQLACVMSGGKLIQNVYGHTSSHYIEDIFGNSLLMTSAHHQMMRPETANKSLVIAWTKHPQSRYYKDGNDKNLYEPYSYQEPEIVYFEDTNALAIQGHPEYSSNNLLHSYCCDLIDFYLFGNQDMKQPYYPLINPAV